jgi:hypothetical protein
VVIDEKKKYLIILGCTLFVLYTFIAARPVPVETILMPRWFISLESTYPNGVYHTGTQDEVQLLPFQLGERFGYVDKDGNFSINQVRKGDYVSISQDRWAEYNPVPKTIEVRDPVNNPVLTIDKSQGYPLFLDERLFLIGSEQNSIALVDDTGAIGWSHDFAAPLTTIDAAAGLVVAGLLDGTVEVLDNQGRRFFFFEPGGSRLSVILGCALSKDGSRMALISGIDEQRFLILERIGDSGNIEYKVLYHEFLGIGFRRPVHVAFVDNDSRIVFARQGGLGLYDIHTRTSLKLPLEGDIIALDESGRDRLLFILTAQTSGWKRLAAIRFPGTLIIEAPFKSETVFLGRQGSRLYVGGSMTLASFEVGKR